MGIEQDIKEIKEGIASLIVQEAVMEGKINVINEKVDLLTIRKQVDRQDKEKAIKDSLKDGCA